MGNKLEPELQEIEFNLPPENHTIDEVFACEICIELFSSRTEKFENINLCTHKLCVDCVMKYIEMNLERNVGRIPCLPLHCDNMLDPISIRPLLRPSLFNKWCDLLCDSTLLEVDRCYCPYENCSALVINECGGDVMKSMCQNCKRWFCFKCQQKWHSGFTCEESTKTRDANDVAFHRLAEREKWIRCPRCRHYVDRIGGCNFMMCRCGSSFCYWCGKQIEGGRACDCLKGQLIPRRRPTMPSPPWVRKLIILSLYLTAICSGFRCLLYLLYMWYDQQQQT